MDNDTSISANGAAGATELDADSAAVFELMEKARSGYEGYLAAIRLQQSVEPDVVRERVYHWDRPTGIVVEER